MPPTSNFGQDITNTANGDNNNGNNDGNGLPNIAQIERMGGRMMLPRLAGKGVIRVVRRCEDAKENNKLGKFFFFFQYFACLSRGQFGMDSFPFTAFSLNCSLRMFYRSNS